MKKYCKASQDDAYLVFSNAVGRVVDDIHHMTDWDSEYHDIYMSSPSSFVDDTIPKIEKLLENAKRAYEAYYAQEK